MYHLRRNLIGPLCIAMLTCAHLVPSRATDNPDEDNYHRLVRFEGKQKVACPIQDSATAVLLIIGQSNAGNFATHFYSSHYGDSIINFFDGGCYIAGSPLLGSQGIGGEPWTQLGNKLLHARTFTKVILVPAAIGGTSVSRWKEGGDINAMLMNVIEATRVDFEITHVLWHQGETDFMWMKMTAQEYSTALQSMISSLRQQKVSAPVFVSVASRCRDDHEYHWTVDNPIATAQRAMPDPRVGVLAGVDSDKLVEKTARTPEGCHFNFQGQEKFSTAWADVISLYEREKSNHAVTMAPISR